MSLRQVQKLRETRESAAALRGDPPREQLLSTSTDSSDEETLRASFSLSRNRPKSAFLVAAGHSEGDSEGDSESEGEQAKSSEEAESGNRRDENGETAAGDGVGQTQTAESDEEVASGEVEETSLSGRKKATVSGKKKRKKKFSASSSRAPGAEAAPTDSQGVEKQDEGSQDFDVLRTFAAGEETPGESSDPHKPGGGSRYCLTMERSMFDIDVELKRIFGREVARNLAGNSRPNSRRGGAAGRRRCWLIADAEEGPGSHEYVRMIKEEDAGTGIVEFALQYTPYYEQLQDAFQAILHSHDHQNLQQFLVRHPRHIDALLQMSEVYRMRGQNETATELTKKALCVLQKSFHPAFSPFTYTAEGLPQVAVDTLNPFNKNIIKCIGLYGAALADQGCYRTALEVAKLLVAMDLPRDAFHTLLHIDYLALRSRQWQFLLHFSQSFVEQHLAYVIPLDLPSERDSQGREEAQQPRKDEDLKLVDLAFMLPNFAFSVALAIALHANQRVCSEDIKTVTADELLAVCMSPTERYTGYESRIHHLLLMRAVLLFPAFVRKLLQKIAVNGSQKVAGSPYPSVTWEDLLFSVPLWASSSFAHHRYSDILVLILNCYVQKAHDVWRADAVLRWLHGCTAHLRHLYNSSPQIKEFAKRWSRSSFLFDVSRYKDVRVSEFDRIPTLPAFLMDANLTVAAAGARHRNRRVQYVSMNSSPIIVFLETLLPWTELDQTGLRAEPRHVSVMARSLLSALCEVATVAWKAIQRFGLFIKVWLTNAGSRDTARAPARSDEPRVGDAPAVQN
ncbi:hypothetical protein TGGT1_290240 [Toxoplasma gondii GT1]|uniref:Transcriptional repressor TCF25 n=2 Tax=Toxoplasma gondii TaxID=5811 RepID=S7UQ89_TOXGG|nr:hypothetical protein TGGT1_290240 [Toxoplasma gondii GT1]KAF4644496.1 hypothetical protein TGRH88_014900 [Toxoplasma gondii]